MFIERGCRLQYAQMGLALISGERNSADGKGSGTYDFTSLLGYNKKQLLRELPSNFVCCSNSNFKYSQENMGRLWGTTVFIRL